MKYGLAVEDIARINDVFAKDPDIQRAIIFGPRVEGKFRKNSPILFVLAGINLMEDEIADVKETLNELGLHAKFDLLLLNLITDPDLLAYIQTTGKAFYKKK